MWRRPPPDPFIIEGERPPPGRSSGSGTRRIVFTGTLDGSKDATVSVPFLSLDDMVSVDLFAYDSYPGARVEGSGGEYGVSSSSRLFVYLDEGEITINGESHFNDQE